MDSKYFDDGGGVYYHITESTRKGKVYIDLDDTYQVVKSFLVGSEKSGYYQDEKQDALERAYAWFLTQSNKG